MSHTRYGEGVLTCHLPWSVLLTLFQSFFEGLDFFVERFTLGCDFFGLRGELSQPFIRHCVDHPWSQDAGYVTQEAVFDGEIYDIFNKCSE